jgi:hypothetical protein
MADINIFCVCKGFVDFFQDWKEEINIYAFQKKQRQQIKQNRYFQTCIVIRNITPLTHNMFEQNAENKHCTSG